MGSVSTADGFEKSPSQALVARTIERFGYRPPLELVTGEPHHAIGGNSIRGEPQERFEDVAKIWANVAVQELPARKPGRIADRPTQETTALTERVDRLARAEAGHLTKDVVRCPRPLLELDKDPLQALIFMRSAVGRRADRESGSF